MGGDGTDNTTDNTVDNPSVDKNAVSRAHLIDDIFSQTQKSPDSLRVNNPDGSAETTAYTPNTIPGLPEAINVGTAEIARKALPLPDSLDSNAYPIDTTIVDGRKIPGLQVPEDRGFQRWVESDDKNTGDKGSKGSTTAHTDSPHDSANVQPNPSGNPVKGPAQHEVRDAIAASEQKKPSDQLIPNEGVYNKDTLDRSGGGQDSGFDGATASGTIGYPHDDASATASQVGDGAHFASTIGSPHDTASATTAHSQPPVGGVGQSLPDTREANSKTVVTNPSDQALSQVSRTNPQVNTAESGFPQKGQTGGGQNKIGGDDAPGGTGTRLNPQSSPSDNVSGSGSRNTTQPGDNTSSTTGRANPQTPIATEAQSIASRNTSQPQVNDTARDSRTSSPNRTTDNIQSDIVRNSPSQAADLARGMPANMVSRAPAEQERSDSSQRLIQKTAALTDGIDSTKLASAGLRDNSGIRIDDIQRTGLPSGTVRGDIITKAGDPTARGMDPSARPTGPDKDVQPGTKGGKFGDPSVPSQGLPGADRGGSGISTTADRGGTGSGPSGDRGGTGLSTGGKDSGLGGKDAGLGGKGGADSQPGRGTISDIAGGTGHGAGGRVEAGDREGIPKGTKDGGGTIPGGKDVKGDGKPVKGGDGPLIPPFGVLTGLDGGRGIPFTMPGKGGDAKGGRSDVPTDKVGSADAKGRIDPTDKAGGTGGKDLAGKDGKAAGGKDKDDKARGEKGGKFPDIPGIGLPGLPFGIKGIRIPNREELAGKGKERQPDKESAERNDASGQKGPRDSKGVKNEPAADTSKGVRITSARTIGLTNALDGKGAPGKTSRSEDPLAGKAPISKPGESGAPVKSNDVPINKSTDNRGGTKDTPAGTALGGKTEQARAVKGDSGSATAPEARAVIHPVTPEDVLPDLSLSSEENNPPKFIDARVPIVQRAEKPEGSSDEGSETAELAQETDRQENDETQSQALIYVVQPGETLESIALKLLKNGMLALLLLELNRDQIPTRLVDGEKVLDLKPGMIISLPTVGQVNEFQQRLSMGLASIFKYAGNNESPDEELAQWEQSLSQNSV